MPAPHISDLEQAAKRFFGRALEGLSEAEEQALRLAGNRKLAARSPKTVEDHESVGDRLADRVAEFGGSWAFIICFGLFLVAWTGANLWLLTRPFDPYPFIFLNLMLSMVAALQAPIIMMSQNRQAAKDRRNAALDYEINLKAEIEIMALHDKLDTLRDQEIAARLAQLEAQLERLSEALQSR